MLATTIAPTLPAAGLSNQAYFLGIIKHLLEQGGPAKSATGPFRYRDTVSGRKCAIGVCIPDRLYVPEMDGTGGPDECGMSLWEVLQDFPRVAEWLPSKYLCKDLQDLHDELGVTEWSPAKLAKLARSLANKYGLSIPDGFFDAFVPADQAA